MAGQSVKRKSQGKIKTIHVSASSGWLANEVALKSELQPRVQDHCLWTDIYEPKTEQDLAIHKAKIQELSDTIYQAISNHSRLLGGSILLLSGPPGSGKTVTLRTILRCKCSGRLEHVNVIEWIEESAADSDDWTSLQEFIWQTSRYADVTACEQDTACPSVLILKNLPSSLSDSLPKLHQLLRWHASRARANCLLVLITASSCSAREGSLPERLLCPQVLRNELGVRRVEFNQVASNLMAKALTRIINLRKLETGVQNTTATVTRNTLLRFGSECSGDLRTAVNQLQFHMKQAPNQRGIVDSSVKDDFRHFRDVGLLLFNALGKILYCKRLQESKKNTSSPAEQPLPDHLSAWHRPPLAFVVEEVLQQCQLDAASIIIWLHENFIDFMPHFKAIHLCSEHISWSDAHLSGGMNWRLGLTPGSGDVDTCSGQRNVIRANNDYGALVVSRSILLGHGIPADDVNDLDTAPTSEPVKQAFRPLRAPRNQWQQTNRFGVGGDWCDNLVQCCADAESADKGRQMDGAVCALHLAHMAVASRNRLLLDWLPIAIQKQMPTHNCLLLSGAIDTISDLCCFGQPTGARRAQFHSRARPVRVASSHMDWTDAWICPPEAAHEGAELPIDEDEE